MLRLCTVVHASRIITKNLVTPKTQVVLNAPIAPKTAVASTTTILRTVPIAANAVGQSSEAQDARSKPTLPILKLNFRRWQTGRRLDYQLADEMN
jgi:hypothetical protein